MPAWGKKSQSVGLDSYRWERPKPASVKHERRRVQQVIPGSRFLRSISEMSKPRLSIAVITALLVVAATINPNSDARGLVPPPPNIVFVMLDDVSTGYLDAMPTVQHQIADRGVEFTNGITPTSLCCPSRAATLTGDLAHTTGVYDNTEENGGWWKFQAQEGDTLATHLHAGGYNTALFGKYLNGYRAAPQGHVPPGWDTFEAFRATNYYNYSLGGTVDEQYGDTPEEYSTDVLTAKAVQFVGQQVGKDAPLFLYYSPYAAHRPMIPAPRHSGTWHNEPLDEAFNEAKIGDKPRFMPKQAAAEGVL